MTLPNKELPEESLDALIAHARTRVVAPLNEWSVLSAQLRDEGLIHAEDVSSVSPRMVPSKHTVGAPIYRSMVSQWNVRVMAGAALFAIGIVIGGGVMQGNHDLPFLKTQSRRVVAEAASNRTFTSTEEARQAVLKAQSEYQRATAYLAAVDTSAQFAGTPALYRERLAALDQVMSVTQRALKNAPQDQLLNQYYQSTLGAREATVQQLQQTLPVGARVSHF
jgi:hypothetical protein